MDRYFKFFEGTPREVILKLDHYDDNLPSWMGDIVIVLVAMSLIIAGLVWGFTK